MFHKLRHLKDFHESTILGDWNFANVTNVHNVNNQLLTLLSFKKMQGDDLGYP